MVGSFKSQIVAAKKNIFTFRNGYENIDYFKLLYRVPLMHQQIRVETWYFVVNLD